MMVQPSRTIGLVALDGANLLEISGPLQVFATATEQIGEMGLHRMAYRVMLVSMAGGPVTTSVGVTLRTTEMGGRGTRLDTLIVAGASPTPASLADPQLVGWVVSGAAKRRRTASVGNGCLLLAAAGLLDGRRVAARGNLFARLYRDWPGISVDPAANVVCDGPIWTAAGASSGMDMALAMIEADWGRRIALRVARRLSLDLIRPTDRSGFAMPTSPAGVSDRCGEPAF